MRRCKLLIFCNWTSRESDMAFEFIKFTEVDSSFAARVTIRQTGQIGFNSGAINRFGIKEKAFVVLYFDQRNRAVGLELTNDRCEGAIEIKKSESNTFLRGKNFCDRFGIDYQRARRYELLQDDGTGILYFELNRELKGETNDE